MMCATLRRTFARLAAAILLVTLSGCAAIKKPVIKGVAGTLTAEGDTISSHDDPELIKAATPFALTLYESLLSSIPEHEPLLTETCSLYTQYAFGFIAAEAEALQWDDFEKSQDLNGRALRLALRGKGYCWRGLERKFKGVSERLKANPSTAVTDAKREHVKLLYWSAASLGAAISAGGLDHPELLIDWPVVRALAERALAIDDTWQRGALHELMITVESQGEALGGSEERARKHFARAIALQRGLAPGPYVALAMGVVKAAQNRAEFEKLLGQALAIDPDQDPSNRLVTLITQQRARVLLAHIDDIFLDSRLVPR
jgi:hypothetical protein